MWMPGSLIRVGFAALLLGGLCSCQGGNVTEVFGDDATGTSEDLGVSADSAGPTLDASESTAAPGDDTGSASPDSAPGDQAGEDLEPGLPDALEPGDIQSQADLPDGAADSGSTPSDLAHFSFFVTSLASIQKLSGSQAGFGGDLRFGETGPGAGLRGADKICAAIAEMSMPGAGAKQWRAFLSATADENGKQVNAIDRIGNGPWYDRLGRQFAAQKSDLLYERPTTADAAIINDFPNEWGVPNHQPDPTQPKVDNHDMLTGSSKQGTLYSASATCKDWTASTGSAAEGKPRVGHSWPTEGGGGGGQFAAPPPGGGGKDMKNWISALDEAGCAPGVNLVQSGPPRPGTNTVGSGGGYGGFYCFALTP